MHYSSIGRKISADFVYSGFYLCHAPEITGNLQTWVISSSVVHWSAIFHITEGITASHDIHLLSFTVMKLRMYSVCVIHGWMLLKSKQLHCSIVLRNCIYVHIFWRDIVLLLFVFEIQWLHTVFPLGFFFDLYYTYNNNGFPASVILMEWPLSCSVIQFMLLRKRQYRFFFPDLCL